jgi:2-haloacid dehalogenase
MYLVNKLTEGLGKLVSTHSPQERVAFSLSWRVDTSIIQQENIDPFYKIQVGGGMLEFDHFDVLTFDCYGTLIDWEAGIWDALRPILAVHQCTISQEQALEMYGEFESKAEGDEYFEYKTILHMVLGDFGSRLGFVADPAELEMFAASVKDWPAFPDSAHALQFLHQKYKLAIISNIDDDLFSYSEQKLQVKFDWIITARQARSYKPSLNNFHLAIERIGLPEGKILHVAQSLFHDIAPAKKLGLSTVWVNRRHDKAGFGATPPAQAQPDLEVPDLQSLASLVGSFSKPPRINYKM